MIHYVYINFSTGCFASWFKYQWLHKWLVTIFNHGELFSINLSLIKAYIRQFFSLSDCWDSPGVLCFMCLSGPSQAYPAKPCSRPALVNALRKHYLGIARTNTTSPSDAEHLWRIWAVVILIFRPKVLFVVSGYFPLIYTVFLCCFFFDGRRAINQNIANSLFYRHGYCALWWLPEVNGSCQAVTFTY